MQEIAATGSGVWSISGPWSTPRSTGCNWRCAAASIRARAPPSAPSTPVLPAPIRRPACGRTAIVLWPCPSGSGACNLVLRTGNPKQGQAWRDLILGQLDASAIIAEWMDSGPGFRWEVVAGEGSLTCLLRELGDKHPPGPGDDLQLTEGLLCLSFAGGRPDSWLEVQRHLTELLDREEGLEWRLRADGGSLRVLLRGGGGGGPASAPARRPASPLNSRTRYSPPASPRQAAASDLQPVGRLGLVGQLAVIQVHQTNQGPAPGAELGMVVVKIPVDFRRPLIIAAPFLLHSQPGQQIGPQQGAQTGPAHLRVRFQGLVPVPRPHLLVQDPGRNRPRACSR